MSTRRLAKLKGFFDMAVSQHAAPLPREVTPMADRRVHAAEARTLRLKKPIDPWALTC
jgi:hypothetical protein